MAEEFPQRHRTTIYAKRIRAALLAKLGNQCALCGEDREELLEFDHPAGRGYNPNTMSYGARMKRYEREAELGQIRLLCRACNLKTRLKDDSGAHIRTEHAALVPLTPALPY